MTTKWEEGLRAGAYKNTGTHKKSKTGKIKQHHGKTPRVGIRKARMAKRAKS